MKRFLFALAILPLVAFSNVFGSLESNDEIRAYDEQTLYWARSYDSGSSGSYLGDIIKTSDGGYLATGVEINQISNRLWLVKMNDYGEVEWSLYMKGANFDRVGVTLEDGYGNFVIAGGVFTGSIYLVKVDSDGNIIFNRIFGATFDGAFGHKVGGGADVNVGGVFETQDGGYIIIGDTQNNLANPGTKTRYKQQNAQIVFFLKVAPNGKREFVTTHENAWQDKSVFQRSTFGHISANSAIQTQDGGYIIVGRSYGSYTHRGLILRIDKDGVFEWIKTYAVGNTVSALHGIVEKDTGDGYIAVGELDGKAWVLAVDSNGNIEKDYRYGNSTNSYVGYSMDKLKDGAFIMAGQEYAKNGGSRAFIMSFNISGEVFFSNVYGPENINSAGDMFLDISQTEDEGFIVAGQTSFLNGGLPIGWVLKLNTTGNLIFNLDDSVGVTSVPLDMTNNKSNQINTLSMRSKTSSTSSQTNTTNSLTPVADLVVDSQSDKRDYVFPYWANVYSIEKDIKNPSIEKVGNNYEDML